MNKSSQSPRPPKNAAIRQTVLKTVASGDYRFSAHALERMRQRSIDQIDVKAVLVKGRHEKRKDEFDPQRNRWGYAFRGIIEDGRNIRIVVAEMDPGILVITAIDLDNDN
jgi:hypothetical protein